MVSTSSQAAGRTPSPPPRVGHSHLHVVVPERRHSTSPTPPPASLASGNDRVRRSLSPTAPVVPPLRNLPQAQSSSVEGANPAQFLTPPPVTEEASGDRRPRASSKRGKKKFKFFSRSNVDPEGGDTSPEVKARQVLSFLFFSFCLCQAVSPCAASCVMSESGGLPSRCLSLSLYSSVDMHFFVRGTFLFSSFCVHASVRYVLSVYRCLPFMLLYLCVSMALGMCFCLFVQV